METIEKAKKKNHRRFVLMVFLLSVYALVGWLRFYQALLNWRYFLEIGLWPHPMYIIISGGMIGLGYTAALVLLFLRSGSLRLYSRLLNITFIVWLWFDRIWIAVRESFSSLLPITILITMCTIAMDIFLLQRIQYRERDENRKREI